jgi:hypothetical protein
MISTGSRGTLLTAMFVKYSLAHTSMTPAEQLEALEALGRLPHDDVTADAIAAVEPCSHDVAVMVMSAMDLAPAGSQKISAGWKVLESEPVWSKLTELNPSLLVAASLCRYGSHKEAA